MLLIKKFSELQNYNAVYGNNYNFFNIFVNI